LCHLICTYLYLSVKLTIEFYTMFCLNAVKINIIKIWWRSGVGSMQLTISYETIKLIGLPMVYINLKLLPNESLEIMLYLDIDRVIAIWSFTCPLKLGIHNANFFVLYVCFRNRMTTIFFLAYLQIYKPICRLVDTYSVVNSKFLNYRLTNFWQLHHDVK
jgi:hypothetical protein